MIGRMYKIAIGAQAQTAAKTLIEIAAPSTAIVVIERAYMGQSSFDTSQMLAARVQRISTTGTGTAHTPRPGLVGDAAFSGVVETNSTIEPSYTASTELTEQAFNVLSGWQWTPASDDEPDSIPPSGLLGIALDVAPSASMDFHYGATIREMG